MLVIFGVICTAARHWCHLQGIRCCPKAKEVWIRMIEGDDHGGCDVWLWMDEDEQWLRRNLDGNRLKNWFAPDQSAWVDAQAALRHRINNQRYTKADRNPVVERICNATPDQRLAAICWLTFNSDSVKKLAIALGRFPSGICDLSSGIGYMPVIRKSWKKFPEADPIALEAAKTNLREDGCQCLDHMQVEEDLNFWFNMWSWLYGENPTLKGSEDTLADCTRCQRVRCASCFTSILYSHAGFPKGNILF